MEHANKIAIIYQDKNVMFQKQDNATNSKCNI